MPPKQSNTIYQIKVTLKDITPPIWRRLLVPADIHLGKLHNIIQAAFGWYDYHMHTFNIGGEQYGKPDPDLDWDDVRPENRLKLEKFCLEKTRFLYTYDMGDSWEHQILVEKVLPRDPAQTYPVCIKGKNACPPEDCGGPWGYAELIEVLRDPEHEEHQSMLEWLGLESGDEFDPTAFNLEEINAALARLR